MDCTNAPEKATFVSSGSATAKTETGEFSGVGPENAMGSESGVAELVPDRKLLLRFPAVKKENSKIMKLPAIDRSLDSLDPSELLKGSDF